MAENIFVTRHSQPTQLTLNINDALDLMQDDNTFMNQDMSVYGSGRSDMYSVASMAQNEISNDVKKKPHVKIIEEPQPKALRFRYICEGRSAGSIPGVNSTAENKTYPTIKVAGYKGPAMVVVSCVTVDTPYRPHPHNLVGKDGCRKGICSMRINNDSMECSFPNLGIQCIKRKDVEEALRIREEQRIDPFHTGFSHRDQTQNIDLNSVRLCFQVFLKDEEKGKFSIPLQPVVSAAIYDKKATSDLIICKLSDCSSCVVGGKDIILLCDKVNKDDVQIRFYEMRGERIHWQAFGDFQASDVHKQVAISFKTPKYDNLEIESSVRVYIQLVRPSDQSKSEPRPFDYLPLESGRPFRALKRLKSNYHFQSILGIEPLPVEDVLTRKKSLNKFPDNFPQPITQNRLISGIKPTIQRNLNPESFQNVKGQFDINPQNNCQTKNLLSPSKLSNSSASLWTAEGICPETNFLNEVLSQGSVNELLSGIGDGIQMYDTLPQTQPLSKAEKDPPFLLPLNDESPYKDSSYTSCYSNLEFVLGYAKKAGLPEIPPKVIADKIVIDENDFGVYGTPSGLPVHPNKEALLKERGFKGMCHIGDKLGEDALPSPPVSDILELDEDLEETKEDLQDIPKAILDLFV